MQFKDFIDDERILSTLNKLGFQEPTPIQTQAIPHIMQGGDLRATSQTGTGKTAAFLLPALMRLAKAPDRRGGAKVLVLVPTRELAMQLAGEAMKLGGSLGLVVVTLYGGVPYPRQNQQLSRRHDILIATPGRLMDLMERNRVPLGNVEMLILDEADRMLDMGFIGPVESIAAQLPATRQTLMFSATFGKGVRKLSETLLKDPVEIAAASTENRQEHIEQRFYRTENLGDKHKYLDEILAEPSMMQAIVFSSTKMQTERLAERLRETGLQVAALHGDMNQRQRTRTIDQFRASKIRILVATDVAARGIDVLTISHVINFDAPNTLDDYIHRIGRTGRAGNKGSAFCFFSQRDYQVRKEIEKFSGVEPSPSDHPKPNAPKKKPFFKQGRNAGFGGKKPSFHRGAPRSKGY